MKYQVLAAACLVSIDVANAIAVNGKPIKTGDNFKDPGNFKANVYLMNRALYDVGGKLDGITGVYKKSLNDPTWHWSLMDGDNDKTWMKAITPYEASSKVVNTVVPTGDLLDGLQDFDNKWTAFGNFGSADENNACTGLPDNLSSYVNNPECYEAAKKYIKLQTDVGNAAKDVQTNLENLLSNQVFTDALAADPKNNGKLVDLAKKSSARAAQAYGAFAGQVLSERNLQYAQNDGKPIVESSIKSALNGLKNALQGYTYLTSDSSWSDVSSRLSSIASAANGLAEASDVDLAVPATNVAKYASQAARQSFTSTDDTMNSMANTNFKSALRSMKSQLEKLNSALTNSDSKTFIDVGYDFATNTLDTDAQARVRAAASTLSTAVGNVIHMRDFNNCTWSQLLGAVGGNVKCVGTGHHV